MTVPRRHMRVGLQGILALVEMRAGTEAWPRENTNMHFDERAISLSLSPQPSVLVPAVIFPARELQSRDGSCENSPAAVARIPAPTSMKRIDAPPLRLACSPLATRTGLNPRPGHFRSFASGNRPGRCSWSTGFLGDLPFPPPFHSGVTPYSPKSPSSTLKTSLLRTATAHIKCSLYREQSIPLSRTICPPSRLPDNALSNRELDTYVCETCLKGVRGCRLGRVSEKCSVCREQPIALGRCRRRRRRPNTGAGAPAPSQLRTPPRALCRLLAGLTPSYATAPEAVAIIPAFYMQEAVRVADASSFRPLENASAFYVRPGYGAYWRGVLEVPGVRWCWATGGKVAQVPFHKKCGYVVSCPPFPFLCAPPPPPFSSTQIGGDRPPFPHPSPSLPAFHLPYIRSQLCARCRRVNPYNHIMSLVPFLPQQTVQSQHTYRGRRGKEE
ncbi:hypothetical protein PR048_031435 [Dryococelus australis]|uniref:Uncharacterized protein n=1 Tax=Dryococelus australis TaxID=614101 RepID=A0ABQ9G6B5_9NEOP|nr:hypothetical protein PR048_031435 [Dryococelus australis]